MLRWMALGMIPLIAIIGTANVDGLTRIMDEAPHSFEKVLAMWVLIPVAAFRQMLSALLYRN